MSAVDSREKAIYKVTWIGFFVNLLLSVAKLLAGIFGRSGAMIADAVHSLSDFLTDLVVLIFVKVSAKPKDADHDYGHGKYETLATILIGVALLVVGIGIFTNSIDMIRRVAQGENINRPGLIALAAAAVSIVAKEILYHYTIHVGRQTDSSVVIANAWHHRSDALSSIGTLIGIGGAYFLGEKWRILDPIAAILVSLLIAKVAFDLIVPGIKELMEGSLSEEEEKKIAEIVMDNKDLSDLHNLKTRKIGSSIAIEMHVRVSGDMSVNQAHIYTRDIEQKLKAHYGDKTQIIVHIEPVK